MPWSFSAIFNSNKLDLFPNKTVVPISGKMTVTMREVRSILSREMVEKEEKDIPKVRPTARVGW